MLSTYFEVSMEFAWIGLCGAGHVLDLKIGIISEPKVPTEIISTLDSSDVHVPRGSSLPLFSSFEANIGSVRENWIQSWLSVRVLNRVLSEVIGSALQVCGDRVVDLTSQVLNPVIHPDSRRHWRSYSGESNPEKVKVSTESQGIVACLLESSACNRVLLIPSHIEQEVAWHIEHRLAIAGDLQEFAIVKTAFDFTFNVMRMMFARG